MRTAVVIVNYRTPRLVLDCLETLVPQVRANRQSSIVIVENGSGDDSAAQLACGIAERGWADVVGVLTSEQNRGFAGGNNVAIRQALAGAHRPEFIWLLNPDTLVHAGALAELIAFMDAHPACGLAGSRLEHRDGNVQRSAFRFHSVAGEIERGLQLGLATRLLARWQVAPPAVDAATRVDWLSGASLMVRTAVFERVGLLDEHFFMYFEETELARRAAAAGFERWYVPHSRVVHLIGQSSGVDRRDVAARPMPGYWFQARRYYFEKTRGRHYANVADVAFASAHALWRWRRAIQRKPDIDPPHLLRDFVRFSFFGTRGVA